MEGTKQCRFCGETIQVDAVVCRFCRIDLRTGEPLAAAPSSGPVPENVGDPDPKPRTPSYGCAPTVLYGALAMLAIGIVLANLPREREPSPPKTASELRQASIERQFSAWDGSHRGLTRVIEDSMNDPDSYEHVKTVYADRGDYLLVTTSFRGKNAFGAVVKNSVKAKVDLKGNVIKIIKQGP